MNRSTLLSMVLSLALSLNANADSVNHDVTVIGPTDFLTINGVTHTGSFEVNGGSLRIENGAIIQGDIQLNPSSTLYILLQSIVDGDILSFSASGILIDQSEVMGGVVAIESRGTTQINDSIIHKLLRVYDQDLSTNNSSFLDDITISGGDTIVVGNATVEGELSIKNSRLAIVNVSEEIDSLTLSNNEDAVLNESGVHKHASITNNVRARVFSNNFLNDNGVIKIKDNLNTEVTGNYFSDTLHLKPGEENCEESNNSYAKIIGSCY